MEPCGTPQVTYMGKDETPFIHTYCCLLVRYLAKKVKSKARAPYYFNNAKEPQESSIESCR